MRARSSLEDGDGNKHLLRQHGEACVEVLGSSKDFNHGQREEEEEEEEACGEIFDG